ncbi:phosphoenolpyruvate--protein phosphotransferase [Helicobacter cholecystus]|uniref:phosphoenolpyruvate--protein phosphotransferase n=1 Tax=Helicobacter cholecystus TaxID=45498 RepID=UPI002738B2A3|nr:phosphoenolpyruvate--protein phosphotransferase [Helicobacter cholecystus]
MKIYQGKCVVSGIAIGKIAVLKEHLNEESTYHILSNAQELERFKNARVQAIEEIKKLYHKALKEVGEEEAMIFDVHSMILEDLDYIEYIEEKIVQGLGAYQAISEAKEYFSTLFGQMDDEYMKARSADIVDVSNRVLKVLQGVLEKEIKEPSIILACDLSPSQTLQMDRSCFLALATQYGSHNSHTAILAKTMGIPACIQMDYDENIDGEMGILDAENGKLYVNPSQELLQEFQALKKIQEQKQEQLQNFKGKETLTLSGKKIMLYANIGNIADAKSALENDAEGIGLFRSEFLYLQNNTYPTEQEQFEAYKAVLELMGGKRVVIRTMDIGADKKIDYFDLDFEENPALGYRAIRICLDRKEIFKTQLRALYKASVYGKLAVMFPMITSLWEISEIKAILSEVYAELQSEGVDYDQNLELGVMIETPASALIAEDLAKEVDFFSIGTNDLTQYTLALDRQNLKLERFADPYHPALFKLFEMVIEAGHRHNCWVGVCGELAGDVNITQKLIDLGVDELSVSPKLILTLRQKILSIK